MGMFEILLERLKGKSFQEGMVIIHRVVGSSPLPMSSSTKDGSEGSIVWSDGNNTILFVVRNEGSPNHYWAWKPKGNGAEINNI